MFWKPDERTFTIQALCEGQGSSWHLGTSRWSVHFHRQIAIQPVAQLMPQNNIIYRKNSWFIYVYFQQSEAFLHNWPRPAPFDLILILIVAATAGSLLGVLPLDAASPAAAEGRLQREVNVLLAVEPHDE